MSGSGGRRDDYPPRIPVRSEDGLDGAGSDPCAISQQAPLNSPRPAVVKTLNVGDVLDVVLNSSGPRPVLEVHAHTGVAGALTHTGHLEIVACIQAGHKYVADVVNRSGPATTLQVRPA